MLMIIAEAKMRNPVVTNTPIVPLLPALPFRFIGSFVPFFPLTKFAIGNRNLAYGTVRYLVEYPWSSTAIHWGMQPLCTPLLRPGLTWTRPPGTESSIHDV
jgi:hypothetical protein